ncbi:MAG: hypothetical protein ACOYJ2_02105 [Rickettsiales bacterium]
MNVETITQTPTKLTIYPDTHQARNTDISEGTSGKTLAKNETKSGADTEYSFWDFLDLINPLQHIPIINTMYREATGDTIKPEMKLAGGAVVGGVFGFVASLADVIFEQETGKDIGSTMVAAVFGDEKTATVQVAQGPKPTEALAALQTPLPDTSSLPLPFARESRDERRERLSQIDPMDKQVLALYGASTPSAHAARAYQQADMRAYLQQSSVNAVF